MQRNPARSPPRLLRKKKRLPDQRPSRNLRRLKSVPPTRPKLKNGEQIFVEGMKSNQGKEFNANLQYSAERRGIEFIFPKDQAFNQQTLGGVPLSQVKETDLMRHVVLVRHNSYLFKGTVEENLRMAKPDATEAEMEEVLVKVNLLGFLQTQDGLQTKLLEKAGNLSGGQCQRLAIARALLRDSAVYIFDEAASNIDVESEELIMDVIHQLARTKTVLLISHRLANVVNSDQIYFLKDGEIKESGKHEELMQLNGEYRHLYDSQMALENYGKEEPVDV
jgi:energy-coupling factor transporter ATP-binding protein EcfA2